MQPASTFNIPRKFYSHNFYYYGCTAIFWNLLSKSHPTLIKLVSLVAVYSFQKLDHTVQLAQAHSVWTVQYAFACSTNSSEQHF